MLDVILHMNLCAYCNYQVCLSELLKMVGLQTQYYYFLVLLMKIVQLTPEWQVWTPQTYLNVNFFQKIYSKIMEIRKKQKTKKKKNLPDEPQSLETLKN